MAIARINITCKLCGNDFQLRRECFNRTEANQYEAWAALNVDTCPKCRRREKEAKEAEKAAAIIRENGLTVPEIVGVSDKQTSYANVLRNRYICNNAKFVGEYVKLMARYEQIMQDVTLHQQFAEAAKAEGMTEEEYFYGLLKRLGPVDIIRKLTEISSSRDVIDLLTGRV